MFPVHIGIWMKYLLHKQKFLQTFSVWLTEMSLWPSFKKIMIIIPAWHQIFLWNCSTMQRKSLQNLIPHILLAAPKNIYKSFNLKLKINRWGKGTKASKLSFSNFNMLQWLRITLASSSPYFLSRRSVLITSCAVTLQERQFLYDLI